MDKMTNTTIDVLADRTETVLIKVALMRIMNDKLFENLEVITTEYLRWALKKLLAFDVDVLKIPDSHCFDFVYMSGFERVVVTMTINPDGHYVEE